MPKRKPARKLFWTEAGRAESFSTEEWPWGNDSSCSPAEMAKAGFYHVGPDDNASCFMCGKDLDGWEEDDVPMKEHLKHSAGCAFVNLHLESNRLKTFKFWPHKSFKAKPKDFAAAGWVHCPSRESWDMVRCFTCDKHLDGWEPEDDPLEEHRSHCKNCPFVWAADGEEDQAEAARETSAAEEADADADADTGDDGAAPAAAAAAKPKARKASSKGKGGKRGSSKRKANDEEDNEDDEGEENRVRGESAAASAAAAASSGGEGKGAAAKAAGRPPKAPRVSKAPLEVSVDVNVDTEAAALAREKHIPEDMTVEEYFKAQCEMHVHALVRSCEKRMTEFVEQSGVVRKVLEDRVAALCS